MIDVKSMRRSNCPGCTVPVGWLVECVILILLVSAIRDMSLNMGRVANEMEYIAKIMTVGEADGHTHSMNKGR